ncbi:MAG: GGDEF domain-containing protein [Gallionella sp.]|nr:GGDEF domain-containing protein [Gallionella sp.]
MPLSWSAYGYGTLTVVVALAAFVVAVRLMVCAIRCRARNGRLLMMLSGIVTLLGLGLASLFDGFDNVVWHHDIPIIPSAWLSGIAGGVIALWFEAFGRHAVERTEMERRLEILATTDPLTGILNRRACLERGKALSESAKRYGHPMTVMMLDIDHFKKVNDTHGHDVGDQALVAVAEVLKNGIRNMDILARWGGEEFLVLLPETSMAGAMLIAERIRQQVSQIKLPKIPEGLTISIGLCEAKPGMELKAATSLADQALYQAKTDGRNRVVHHQ